MAGKRSRKMKSRVADSLTRGAIEQYSRAVLYHFCLAAIVAIVVVGGDTTRLLCGSHRRLSATSHSPLNHVVSNFRSSVGQAIYRQQCFEARSGHAQSGASSDRGCCEYSFAPTVKHGGIVLVAEDGYSSGWKIRRRSRRLLLSSFAFSALHFR